MEQSGPIIVHCRSDSNKKYFLSLKQSLVILLVYKLIVWPTTK